MLSTENYSHYSNVKDMNGRNQIKLKISDLLPANRPLRYMFSSVFLFSSIFFFNTSGQISVGTQSQIVIPQAAQFQQVNTVQFSNPVNQKSIFGGTQFSNIPAADQNRQIQEYQKDLQKEEAREQQIKEAKKDLQQEEFYKKYQIYLAASQSYRNSFDVLTHLNPDSFSLTKAIYLVESAYDNSAFTYAQFLNAVQQRADLVKQILKRERLDTNNNAALNYGIQKLFSQANTYYNPKTKKTSLVQPLKYDFNDFMGEKDYRQVFVSKLLMTGKGQCHSMPLLYLAIAEQLGAKAYLSLAPEHSFIQFFDENNNRYSFEATNGCIISQSWMMRSGFINAAALKNKLYLDTLSSRKLYAQCLADLLLSYENKFGQDEFAEKLWRKIIANNPTNLIAKQTAANFINQYALTKIKEAGMPPLKDLPNYPAAYKAYMQMVQANNEIDDLGFQEMPKEAYQNWRKTIDREKRKQDSQQAQEQMKHEIDMLKKIKTKISLKPKG